MVKHLVVADIIGWTRTIPNDLWLFDIRQFWQSYWHLYKHNLETKSNFTATKHHNQGATSKHRPLQQITPDLRSTSAQGLQMPLY